MKKYRCSIDYFTEEIIEAEDEEEAEKKFWEIRDLNEIDSYLRIRQYKRGKGEKTR